MTISDWLATRPGPPPPERLANRIASLVGARAPDPATPRVFLDLATTLLGNINREKRHSRADALDLLAVDALVTYAFELASADANALPGLARSRPDGTLPYRVARVIDLHTHLLPGVDDGSPTLENSVRILEQLRADGVTELACTPHLQASDAGQAPVAHHRALLDELRQRAPADVKLHSGFEIMLDAPGCDLRLPHLALGESKAVLVEFPRVPLTHASTDELLRLRSSGIVPVIAHPERYQGITFDLLHIWRDMGVVIQGDGLLLLAAGPKAQFARRMLTAGVCDIIASDNHGDRRSLGTVRMWLREVGGDRQARTLLEVNPAHLLADEMLQPVAPLTDHKSIWDRLRDLLIRRRTGDS